jgi:hypothetical protein
MYRPVPISLATVKPASMYNVYVATFGGARQDVLVKLVQEVVRQVLYSTVALGV